MVSPSNDPMVVPAERAFYSHADSVVRPSSYGLA